MYICFECNTTFAEPKKITEKHGLSIPPYEIICVCPNCKSQNYELKHKDFCRCCGARLPDGKENYCSVSCKKRGEKLFERQHSYNQKLLQSPIYAAVRKVDSYNQTNRTRLSYGQFFAKFKKGGKNDE